MKALSTNQKIFALITVLLSTTFFYYLYHFIESEQYNYVIACSTMFGSAMFLFGFVLGYRDMAVSKTLSLDFGYHLITYLIVNVLGAIFLLIFKEFSLQNGLIILSTLLFWGLGLAVHYNFGRKKEIHN